jgi:hypothetical protein
VTTWTWERLGLSRSQFLGEDTPYPAARRVFVRSYLPATSGYESLADEPDEEFVLDVSMLRPDAAELPALHPGDWVYFLGEAKDEDGHDEEETVLWRPVYVVEVEAGSAISLLNLAVARDYVRSSDLEPDLRSAVREHAYDGSAVPRGLQKELLALYW